MSQWANVEVLLRVSSDGTMSATPTPLLKNMNQERVIEKNRYWIYHGTLQDQPITCLKLVFAPVNYHVKY